MINVCANWIKSNLQDKAQLILALIISILIAILIVKNLDVKFLINFTLISSAFYLFLVTSRDFSLKRKKIIHKKLLILDLVY